jgi:hypothetical protein
MTMLGLISRSVVGGLRFNRRRGLPEYLAGRGTVTRLLLAMLHPALRG